MAILESLQALSSDHPWALTASVALAAGTSAYLQSQHYQLRHIPTVGSSSWPLLSYFGARRYSANALQYFQEGYERYPGQMFKVATLDRWLVVVTGQTLVREIAAIPDDALSALDAISELTHQRHFTPHDILDNPVEMDTIKRDLTRNLTVLFPEVYDEVRQAFDEYIPKTDDWIPIPAFNIILMVVARASNRALVGVPFCRNMDYLTEAMTYTRNWSETSNAIAKYPGFLKPFVSPYLNKLPAGVKRFTDVIGPEIDRRREMFVQYGKDHPGKANDFLEWMLNYWWDKPGGTTENIAYRLMVVNFAALHTSSTTFTHILYTLAANPQWIQPLREEVERVFAEEGMTKAAMQKMVKLDSFFRESNRTNPLSGGTLMRKVLKPKTFRDGTHLPVGTMTITPTMPHQMDAANYANPTQLDPTRFEQAKDSESPRKYFTSVDSEYLAFGIGKHACPGRFFAGNELKVMMAHVLLNYDVRTEVEGVRPTNMRVETSILPDMQANVMFRKRQA